MALFDILAIVVIGLSVLFGLVKGFVHQLIKAAGLAGAILIIYYWRADVVDFLAESVGIPRSTASYLVVPVVLFGVFIIVSIPAYLLRAALRRTRFGTVDRIMGLLFGAAKGCVLCAGLLFILVQFPGETVRKALVRHRVFHESWAADKLVQALKRTGSLLPQDFFTNAELLQKESPKESFRYFHENFWAKYAALKDDEARQRFLETHRNIAFHTELQVAAVVDENDGVLLIDNFHFERPCGPGGSGQINFRVKLEISYRPAPEEETLHSGETLFVSGRIRDFKVTPGREMQYTVLADAEEVNRLK